MSKIKTFFKNLFGGGGPSVICMKGGNNLYYKAVKEQGAWVTSGPGYADCAACKAATGATECRE
jgi:hypothetical protein